MKLELIFAFFALLGVIDKLIGDRFRLGQAFVLSYDRVYALPMVVGKLVGGIVAVLLAIVVCKRQNSPQLK